MNRRELFTRVGLASAAVATVTATAPATAPVVEPVPRAWDFEQLASIDMDCSVRGIEQALDCLGWSSGLAPQPLLCVHPACYASGLQDAAAFGGLVEVWATREIAYTLGEHPRYGQDIDAWFVAWRGRRVGSVGA